MRDDAPGPPALLGGRRPDRQDCARVVTDVGRLARTSTPRPTRGVRRLRWVVAPTLALVAVCSCTVLIVARPASAGGVATARAQAAALHAELQTIETSSAGSRARQYDADADPGAPALEPDRHHAAPPIASYQPRGHPRQATLQKAAVNAYVNERRDVLDEPALRPERQRRRRDDGLQPDRRGQPRRLGRRPHERQRRPRRPSERRLHGRGARLPPRGPSTCRATQLRAQALSRRDNSALAAANADVQAQLRRSARRASRAAAQLQPPTSADPEPNFPAAAAQLAGRTIAVARGRSRSSASRTCWGGASSERRGLLRPHDARVGGGRRRPAPLLGRPDGRLDARARVGPRAGRPPFYGPAATSTSRCTSGTAR